MTEARDKRRERAVEESTSLLKNPDPKRQLTVPVRRILEVVGRFADELCEGVEFHGLTKAWTLRCIIRKTQEALETILRIAEEDTAYYAMPLLRPMCEELIFARYLQTLSDEDASQYLSLKTSLEILGGLRAQASFFPKAQEEMLPPRIYKEVRGRRGTSHPAEPPDLERRIGFAKGELEDLSRKLDWDRRHFPTVKFMAEATDSLDEYEFFYHAASGSVHANTHHLARMGWGDPHENKFSISNRNFNEYYFRFVLVYGVWLTFAVTEEVRESFPDAWPEEEEDAYAVWITMLLMPNLMHRFPPLITREEFRWPKNPSD